MVVGPRVLHGYFVPPYKATVGAYLESGEYFRAHVDTGCSLTLLFSSLHALELNIPLPPEYNIPLDLAGEAKGMAGLTTVTLRWFDGLLTKDVFVLEMPKPGSLARKPLPEDPPLALLGMQMLFDCQLSIRVREQYQDSVVRIRKIR